MALHAIAPVDATDSSREVLCPECGGLLLAPEVSEFVDDGRVRHRWACEGCGNEFRTTIFFGQHA